MRVPQGQPREGRPTSDPRGSRAWTLYDSPLSGNCYKVRLLLSHLGLAYERAEVDATRHGRRPPDLLRHNPAGQVPVLVDPEGRAIVESNAILIHLAAGTDYVPEDPRALVEVLRWMFFEQNNHAAAIATNRYLRRFSNRAESLEALVAFNHRRGTRALEVVDAWLRGRPFLAGQRYTVADMALYAYTHVAEEGGFEPGPLRATREWMDRVRGQPGHVPMSG